jgi:hypothetical protein
MLPDEAQAIMAKVMLFIFATCVLCLGRARAADLNNPSLSNNHQAAVSAIVTLK